MAAKYGGAAGGKAQLVNASTELWDDAGAGDHYAGTAVNKAAAVAAAVRCGAVAQRHHHSVCACICITVALAAWTPAGESGLGWSLLSRLRLFPIVL
jgi:hypothetical protein